MKKTVLFVAVTIMTSLTIVSCKKDYTCTCGDSEGEYNVFTVTTTEDRANEQCDAYYASQIDLLLTDTTCSIK